MDQRKILWFGSYLFTSSNSHLGNLSSSDMNHSSDTNHVSLSSVTDVVDVHFVRRRVKRQEMCPSRLVAALRFLSGSMLHSGSYLLVYVERTKKIKEDCEKMATEVLNDKTNCDTKETIRRTFYKNRIKKDNIKLELDEKSHQEERRKLLLEYQKKHRDEAFNAARGIFQELYFSELENMDVEEYPSKSKYPQKYKKINRMMLSEWMLDVPQDFSESWIMVPCPIGNRTRIVSRYGTTKAYSRKGVLCDTFPSALPGGNPDADMHQSAIVDCIWVNSQQVYYILDILYWGRLPFTNCEAEFRLYWINSKICETTEFKERDADINKYSILPLQNINCNSDLSSALTHLDFEPNCIDGFLFYHRNAQYNFGCTPLVTWLKSFMLSEVLGIFVPSSLDEKPNDYINFEHYMENINAKKNDYKKRIVKNFMEIEYVA